MATLHDINYEVSMSIYFFNNDDLGDREWIKYRIVVESVWEHEHSVIFDDNTANTDLYLESYIEPEVPELVEKIRKLCNAQLNDLMFSPIDDQDFSLVVQPAAEAFEVSLKLELAKETRTFTMRTSREHLLDFAKDMEWEYRELIRGKHGLVLVKRL